MERKRTKASVALWKSVRLKHDGTRFDSLPRHMTKISKSADRYMNEYESLFTEGFNEDMELKALQYILESSLPPLTNKTII